MEMNFRFRFVKVNWKNEFTVLPLLNSTWDYINVTLRHGNSHWDRLMIRDWALFGYFFLIFLYQLRRGLGVRKGSMDYRKCNMAYSFNKRKFNWFTIFVVSTSIVLSRKIYKNFHFTWVIIFDTVLGVRLPNIVVYLSFQFDRKTSRTLIIPLRMISNTVPINWKINANKHLIKNCPPITIINQESSIIFCWIKFFILIRDTLDILIDLFRKSLHFYTLISPFTTPFCVPMWISNY